MENGPFMDVLPTKMVMLNTYVSLPEGNYNVKFDKKSCCSHAMADDQEPTNAGMLWRTPNLGVC